MKPEDAYSGCLPLNILSAVDGGPIPAKHLPSWFLNPRKYSSSTIPALVARCEYVTSAQPLSFV